MKTFMLIACIFICAKTNAQTTNDEKDIRDVFDKMNEAWGAHDYSYKEYDILDDSAVLINPVGVYWKNKEEITQGLQYLGEVRFKYLSVAEEKILSVRFLSPTVALAIAWGKYIVTEDFTMPGEVMVTKKGKVDEGLQAYTLAKKENKWKITSMSVTHIVKR